MKELEGHVVRSAVVVVVAVSACLAIALTIQSASKASAAAITNAEFVLQASVSLSGLVVYCDKRRAAMQLVSSFMANADKALHRESALKFQDVTRVAFEEVRPLRRLSWLPRIPRSERRAYEAMMIEGFDLSNDTTIWDQSGEHTLNSQANGISNPSDYYPVTYEAASDGKSNLLYDFGSTREARAKIAQSAATGRIVFLPNHFSHNSRLVFLHPVFSRSATGRSDQTLQGFLLVEYDTVLFFMDNFNQFSRMVSNVAMLVRDDQTNETLMWAIHDCHECNDWRISLESLSSPQPVQVQSARVPYTTELSFHVEILRLPGFKAVDDETSQLLDGLFSGVVCIMLCVCFLVLSEAWRTRRLLRQKRMLLKDLESAKKAQEAANKAKGDFLAFMCHELRNPIHCVLATSDDLLDSAATCECSLKDGNGRSGMCAIRTSSELMLRIVNDVLDMAKIEHGRMEFETIPVDLRQLCSTVLLANRPYAIANNLHFEATVDDNVPHLIEGDPTRLLQVMSNLISNAVKFTKHGSVAMKVSADMVEGQTAAQLCISVSDTGMGIPQEVQAHLFEPYTQAKVSISRQFGGTGLGLSICKSIIEHMKGHITVESQAGVGTTFITTITVPVLVASPSVEKRSLAQVKLDDMQMQTCYAGPSNIRVLVVDDQPTNVTILKRILERNVPGVSIFTGHSGQDALDILDRENDRMDIVLMDVLMPVMDGLTATRKLRERGCQLPIIAVTANAMREDVDHALQAGMSDVLLKPFRKQQILHILHQYCICHETSDSQGDQQQRSTAAKLALSFSQSVRDQNSIPDQVTHPSTAKKDIHLRIDEQQSTDAESLQLLHTAYSVAGIMSTAKFGGQQVPASPRIRHSSTFPRLLKL